jgi:DNA-binding CsgD family transcriptional regulator
MEPASIFDYQKQIIQKLTPFIAPFSQSFNIQTFGYRKFLLDGRSFGICTNDEWNAFYRNNLLQINIESYEKEVRHTSEKGKYSCFRLGKPDPKDFLCKNLYRLNIWNTLCLYRQDIDYVEGFYFATNKENADFANFCLNNISTFEHYVTYIKQKLSATSDKQIMDKISLPTIPKESFTQSVCLSKDTEVSFLNKIQSNKIVLYKGASPITISKREIERLYYIAQGRSMKETAYFLCLSPRTVEDYLNKLKEKTGVHNKSGLINFFCDNVTNLNALSTT